VHQCFIIVSFNLGFGTSNHGNTARRFFENPALSAEITSLDQNLLLQILTCGKEIDPEKYKNFSDETSRLFVQLYGWCRFPVTVHKVLCHGADIIRNFNIAPGRLTEEASEARNTDVRRFLDRHRLNNLLISSDPLINRLRDVKLENSKD
jgi:hypothetical protein